MDPNANLLEQEYILTHWKKGDGRRPVARRLYELRRALTDWRAAGGFDPDWSKAPHARTYYSA